MFGIGFVELAVIAVVAIVFVGPQKLPELMKQVGKFFVHARRMSNEVKDTFDEVVKEAEKDLHLENLKKIKDLTNGALTHPFIDTDNNDVNDDEELGHHHTEPHRHEGEDDPLGDRRHDNDHGFDTVTETRPQNIPEKK